MENFIDGGRYLRWDATRRKTLQAYVRVLSLPHQDHSVLVGVDPIGLVHGVQNLTKIAIKTPRV